MLKKIFTNRVIKFCSTGILNTAVDFSLFTILITQGTHVILANILSITASFIVSFTINSQWTFSDRDNSIRKIIPYFFFTALGILFHSAILYIFINTFTISFIPENIFTIFSKAITSVVIIVYNYLIYNFFVFKPLKAEKMECP